MRAVVQLVAEAHVDVGNERVASMAHGFLVLLGVKRRDTPDDAAFLARKVATLRVFQDEAGKMNRSLADVEGSVIAVSQFTLYGDTRGGNRPSFTEAASPDDGRRLYGTFVERLRDLGVDVQTGIFQSHMKVGLVIDGPVTIIIDSSDRSRP